MRGGGGGMMDDEERVGHAEIPTSFGPELRACLRCRLVKTYDQFRQNGCENCPFLEMDREHDNVVNCTTPNFTGIISLMDPSRSWAARWLRIDASSLCDTFVGASSLRDGARPHAAILRSRDPEAYLRHLRDAACRSSRRCAQSHPLLLPTPRSRRSLVLPRPLVEPRPCPLVCRSWRRPAFFLSGKKVGSFRGAIRLLFRRNFQKSIRGFARTTTCSMCRPSVSKAPETV